MPTRRLRIAQVAPLWASVPPRSYGGAELVVHLLTEELVERGHDVTLFASGDSRTKAMLRSIHERSVLDAMRAGEAHEYDHYANACLVDALRGASDFDVIHCHLGFAQIPISSLSPKPLLQTMHVLPTIDDMRMLERYPSVSVAAVSRFQASALPEERRRRTRVVPHGIDFSRYELRTSPGEYLVFLGRMGPQKSPHDAIRIAQAAGVPLVLAGVPQNSGEETYFAERVRPLVDGTNVSYVGAVDHAQKNELLGRAAALLFPIQGVESFGVAMVEAMACGTPVLGWRRASVPEVVDEGTTGFCGDSVEELASLVPAVRALDRRTVREHAMRRFGHARMAEDYERAYEALIDEAD
jgi:glycosyltransferase involved in cell wall biosynthesis